MNSRERTLMAAPGCREQSKCGPIPKQVTYASLSKARNTAEEGQEVCKSQKGERLQDAIS